MLSTWLFAQLTPTQFVQGSPPDGHTYSRMCRSLCSCCIASVSRNSSAKELATPMAASITKAKTLHIPLHLTVLFKALILPRSCCMQLPIMLRLEDRSSGIVSIYIAICELPHCSCRLYPWAPFLLLLAIDNTQFLQSFLLNPVLKICEPCEELLCLKLFDHRRVPGDQPIKWEEISQEAVMQTPHLGTSCYWHQAQVHFYSRSNNQALAEKL